MGCCTALLTAIQPALSEGAQNSVLDILQEYEPTSLLDDSDLVFAASRDKFCLDHPHTWELEIASCKYLCMFEVRNCSLVYINNMYQLDYAERPSQMKCSPAVENLKKPHSSSHLVQSRWADQHLMHQIALNTLINGVLHRQLSHVTAEFISQWRLVLLLGRMSSWPIRLWTQTTELCNYAMLA